MHILLTANSTWNILNFRTPLIEAFLAEGHKLSILAPPHDSVEKLHRMGCNFFPIEIRARGLSPLSEIALIRRFRQCFSDISPDVILGFTIKNNIYGAIAARRLNIPFIPNVTGLGTAFLSSIALQKIVETLYRFSFRGLPVVFFQNPDDIELFCSHRILKHYQSRLLPGSGIDLKYFRYHALPTNDVFHFLFVGRLIRDKGILEFVEAARIVQNEYKNVRFLLLGELNSDNRGAISREIINSWEQEGIVEYIGESADVRKEISAADCVVLPSYREGMPRTLIEAAAMGRPIIATNVPGCREIVEHGVNGLLCNSHESSSLAKSFRELLKMSEYERAEMGRKGRERTVRMFDQTIVVDAYRVAIEYCLDTFT